MWNWNRNIGRQAHYGVGAFNWTNVELKRKSRSRRAETTGLLIEPMWNWNINCSRNWFSISNLLIEPMWNWNAQILSVYGALNSLLIEPMWNWNCCKDSFQREASGPFNWTNVELKRYQDKAHKSACSLLLIEPMWNWNQKFLVFNCATIETFNWTNVELKRLIVAD